MPQAAHQVRSTPSSPRRPALRARPPAAQPIPLTLMDLVRAVYESAEDEREAVATLNHMLQSGRVQFEGNLRGKLARIG